ncbi:tpr-like protein [Nannochloropsis gaditana]|uniref:Tpr-like protein n=1 Tax=Nannochloropsis gaditana TaxID=72520 RepID=W7TDD7_9STRA|nr:tpr-like protein [Nannochloropsis gaditana]
MTICIHAQRPKETVAILDRMGKAGVPVGLSSYNLAVEALAHQGEWKKALKIITYMERQAVWPDTRTYTSALDACARAGEWQRALLLLEEMVTVKGVPPAIGSYNAVLSACVKGGQSARATTFFQDMVKKEVGVDARSFAVAIAACEDGNLVDQALALEGRGRDPPLPRGG